MRKILTIANREYRAMVGTKAFLISVIMMPLLMLGSIFAMEMLKNLGDVTDQKIVVIDHSGELFQPLLVAANQRNKLIDEVLAEQAESDETGAPLERNGNRDKGLPAFSKGQHFLLERWEQDSIDDQQRWELCERIRRQEIYAFVEIPADVMEAELPLNLEQAGDLPKVRFYSEDSTFSDARNWLTAIVNSLVKARRLEDEGIDPLLVERASLPIAVRGLGLLERSSDDEIIPASEKNELLTIFLPLGIMLMMFMVIFMASQPMLETVLEEKAQRIAGSPARQRQPVPVNDRQVARRRRGLINRLVDLFARWMVDGPVSRLDRVCTAGPDPLVPGVSGLRGPVFCLDLYGRGRLGYAAKGSPVHADAGLAVDDVTDVYLVHGYSRTQWSSGNLVFIFPAGHAHDDAVAHVDGCHHSGLATGGGAGPADRGDRSVRVYRRTNLPGRTVVARQDAAVERIGQVGVSWLDGSLPLPVRCPTPWPTPASIPATGP